MGKAIDVDELREELRKLEEHGDAVNELRDRVHRATRDWLTALRLLNEAERNHRDLWNSSVAKGFVSKPPNVCRNRLNRDSDYICRLEMLRELGIEPSHRGTTWRYWVGLEDKLE